MPLRITQPGQVCHMFDEISKPAFQVSVTMHGRHVEYATVLLWGCLSCM